jgi:uncharacterized protein YdhG (YjbR/CyaY superfamily)
VIDQYLAQVPEPARAALQKLRQAIRAAAPKATETISYRLAAFRHEGMLVAFGAAANHWHYSDGVGGAPNGISVPRWSLSKGHLKESRPWASLARIWRA